MIVYRKIKGNGEEARTALSSCFVMAFGNIYF